MQASKDPVVSEAASDQWARAFGADLAVPTQHAVPGMKELVQKVAGGPVRVGYPRGIAGLPTQLQKPTFSATVGLLLWGIKHQGERRIYGNAQKTLWGNKSKGWQILRGRGERAKVQVG